MHKIIHFSFCFSKVFMSRFKIILGTFDIVFILKKSMTLFMDFTEVVKGFSQCSIDFLNISFASFIVDCSG